MAGKLITLDEAAQKLGVSADELNEMRSRGEIYGYRDGATWKFKAEDLERLAADRANPPEEPSGLRLGESSEDMILVSEFEIGASGPSTSSTIIGKAGQVLSPDDSDIRLTTQQDKGGGDPGSDVTLAEGSGVEIALGSGAMPSAGGSDLELPVHEDDAVVIDGGSDLSLELSEAGSNVLDAADPDEFVLHASGVGSDITISPGDSGISLVDPSDSGLSLEAPLELKTPAKDDSEEFDLSSSDQVVAVESDSSFDSDSIVDVKSDDEFLLTPLEEVGEEDSMDSGSQVIALDTDSGLLGESGAGLLGGASSDSVAMSGMLEVDESNAGASFDSGAFGAAAAAQTAPVAMAGPMSAREAQFTGGVVAGLGFGVLFMALAGMMTYDLMINMWSWDGAFTVNSTIMDTIVGMFEG